MVSAIKEKRGRIASRGRVIGEASFHLLLSLTRGRKGKADSSHPPERKKGRRVLGGNL